MAGVGDVLRSCRVDHKKIHQACWHMIMAELRRHQQSAMVSGALSVSSQMQSIETVL